MPHRRTKPCTTDEQMIECDTDFTHQKTVKQQSILFIAARPPSTRSLGEYIVWVGVSGAFYIQLPSLPSDSLAIPVPLLAVCSLLTFLW